MLNQVILLGRLSKTPELKEIGETRICNFDIAIDNPRKDADGNRGTTFLPVVCFNATALNVINFLDKGSKVAIVGSIQQRNFLRKDGSKGSAYEIIADSVEFIEVKLPEDKEVPQEPAEEVDVKEDEAVAPSPKFDAYTGKPLKPKAKK